MTHKNGSKLKRLKFIWYTVQILQDSAKTWNYIHPSGSPCGRRHQLRGNLRTDELPDLIPLSTPQPACSTTVAPPVSAPRASDQVICETGLTTYPNTSGYLPVSTPHATGQLVAHTVSNPEMQIPISVSAQRTSVQDDTNRKMTTSMTIDRNEELIQSPVSTPPTDPGDTIPGEAHVNTSKTATIPTHTEPPKITRVQSESTVNVSRESDIQTAHTLLELHKTLDLPDDNLIADYDNSEIMPVNAPPVPDYSKDYPLPASDDKNDTDATVEYSDVDAQMDDAANPNTDSHIGEEQSPPGRFNYRHHGIRRNLGSPKTKPKKFQCIYCPTVTDSKRDMNTHHRSSHGIMTCVDCGKTFPTPDSLQGHRYIHQQDHEHFKCEICDYMTAFESDMKWHKIQHVDEKMWDCTNPNCDRSFKRKSDMTSHAKTHINDDQRCPAQGCDYSNKDPRNLKRHMKIHSNVKPLKCPMCPERFKYHQQLKRHKENHP